MSEAHIWAEQGTNSEDNQGSWQVKHKWNLTEVRLAHIRSFTHLSSISSGFYYVKIPKEHSSEKWISSAWRRRFHGQTSLMLNRWQELQCAPSSVHQLPPQRAADNRMTAAGKDYKGSEWGTLCTPGPLFVPGYVYPCLIPKGFLAYTLGIKGSAPGLYPQYVKVVIRARDEREKHKNSQTRSNPSLV